MSHRYTAGAPNWPITGEAFRRQADADRLQVARERGRIDHRLGLGHDDNPYRRDCSTDEAEYWNVGWQIERDELLRRAHAS